MTTKTTVSLSVPPTLPVKPFNEFQRGETLLPLNSDGRPNGAVGLKLDAQTILWLCTSDGVSSLPRCCESVRAMKCYAVPTAVDITVTL